LLSDPNCEECQRLWQEYAQATTAHIKLDSKLRLAAIGHEHEQVPELTRQVEKAGALRASLREAIQKHDLAHGGVDGNSPPISPGPGNRKRNFQTLPEHDGFE